MRYTKEQLVHHLKKLAKMLKKTPTAKDMDSQKDMPSSSTYSSRFGSWNKSLKKAGLAVNTKKYTQEELILNLKQVHKELNMVPRAKDLKKWAASYSTYRKYFGSWKNALNKAKITSSYMSLKKY